MTAEQMTELILDKKVQTPSYVFDLDVLSAHIDHMKELTEGHVSLCYAMKANPLLISTIHARIGKIEVCSPGELMICKQNGIPGSSIIFSGVNKTKADVEEALDYGVSVITAESEKHFVLIRDYCHRHNVSVHVLLRLASGAQFGMDETLVENMIEHRKEYPQLIIDGIHYFSGTQKKKLEKMEEELQFLKHFLVQLQDKYQYRTSVLEYGAGLSVPYFEGEDDKAVYDNLIGVIRVIEGLELQASVTLELGRFFTWSCGYYLTEVEDIKVNHGHNYAIVDGGIHQLNYYGQNMAMRVPKIRLIRNGQVMPTADAEQAQEWTICGSLCTFADVLVRKWTGHKMMEDDLLIFENAGAYSITEAPALFLSRRMPAVYEWSRKKGLICIRDAKEPWVLNCRAGE